MKKILKINFVILLLTSTQVFAQENTLQQVFSESSTLTKYAVLKKAYAEGVGEKISLTEIENLGKRCVSVNSDAPDQLYDTKQFVITFKKLKQPAKPAEPGRGPLFPPTPETPDIYESRIYVTMASLESDDPKELVVDEFTTRLDITQSSIVQWAHYDGKVYKFRRNTKKVNNTLLSLTTIAGDANTLPSVAYSYCW